MSVFMEDAAEAIASSYVEASDLVRIGDRCEQWVQGPGVRDALVGPMSVVELLELPECVEEVVLVPDQGPVQELVSAGLHPPFRAVHPAPPPPWPIIHRADRQAAHPALGPREQQLGSPLNTGRARPPRLLDRPIHRLGDPARCRHRPCLSTLRPHLAPVPLRPGPRHHRHRLPAPRRRVTQAPVRPDLYRARHPTRSPRRRYRPPHRRVDHAAGEESRHDSGLPDGLTALPPPGPGLEVHPVLRRRLRGRRRGGPAQPTPGTESERNLRKSRGHPPPGDPRPNPHLRRGPRPSSAHRLHQALQPAPPPPVPTATTLRQHRTTS
ncbi:hypothetical protein SANTM175S_06039 [Streptomyces antimycoticus]